MINIKYIHAYSDETNKYLVELSRPMTVREFIDEWLETRPNEWGYFGIYDHKSIFGNPVCEYCCGKIVTPILPTNFLESEIKCAHGSGGWTRSDFQFEVER